VRWYSSAANTASLPIDTLSAPVKQHAAWPGYHGSHAHAQLHQPHQTGIVRALHSCNNLHAPCCPHRLEAGTLSYRANHSRTPMANSICAWCSLSLNQEPDTPERKYSAATLTAEWNVPSGSVISRIPPLHRGMGTSCK
jgi:hypothetical protein